MATALKWIVGLIIIAGLGYLVWWSGWLKSPAPAPTPVQTATSTDQAQAQPPAPLNGMSASNDASDAAVAQDTAAIDAQMQGLGTDSSSVDSSLNDKPVTQSY